MTSTQRRTLHAEEISDAVAGLYMQANRIIPAEMRAAVARALEEEASPGGRDVLNLLLENYAVAEENGLPMCQDTGLAVVMVELGQQLQLAGDLTRRSMPAYGGIRGRLSAQISGRAPLAPCEYRR